MKDLNLILDAVTSTNPRTFTRMFECVTRSGPYYTETPDIVKLLNRNNYKIQELEDLIYDLLLEHSMDCNNIGLYVNRGISIYTTLRRIDTNTSIDIERKPKEYLEGYLFLYQNLSSTNPDINITIAYLKFVSLALSSILRWSKEFSEEDLYAYRIFNNKMLNCLPTSCIEPWLENQVQYETLKDLIVTLDWYQKIPKAQLDVYKALNFSDAKCCVMYNEQCKNIYQNMYDQTITF